MIKLEQKIKNATELNGDAGDRVYLLDDAHHACNPNNPRQWKAPAIFFSNDNNAEVGAVWWDFECVENYDDLEDSTDLPWDDSDVYEFVGEEGYNLLNDDEMEDFKDVVTDWI